MSSVLLTISFLIVSIASSSSMLLNRDFNIITNNLINFDSTKIKPDPIDFAPETFYYSPFINLQPQNDTTAVTLSNRDKRNVDATFRGRPKSIQEVWARNFNISTEGYQQSTSLVALLSKVIIKYFGACIPVILYDEFVEKSEGFVLQRLLQEFPSTFIHGKINLNNTVDNHYLLEPPDSKCRSYVLFLSDALIARSVIGSQIENKVIIVPRSSQWKLQEFLASTLSRDIINLLVIGESYSADKSKERPYILYTHKLYTDGLGSNKPHVLTSWMRGKLTRPHVDLFPKKLTKGFAGHRFSVTAAEFPPYVFKISTTDGVGNVQIRWDGYEVRILQVLGRMMNFTFDVGEAKNLMTLGPGDAVAEVLIKGQYDIGISGMFVTAERSLGMEMSVAHSSDCAAFITMSSKALPRYRAILGPFQWPVWLCLTMTYLLAIIPLAYSDSLSIRYLIENPGQIENMFWYVFGTFTNSLTFAGELSWSNSKKSSTRLLVGFYWVFTIIITACYTGSIIAFVTMPVYPETVDSINQLNGALYRIGTLDRGGWERWFLNSYDKETSRLFKKLEYVQNVQEGFGNVTNAYFLFPYAFIGSRAQLDYLIQTNYTDDKLGRRSALHISDECFALFGVSLAFKEQSVFRTQFNDGILMLQQGGLIQKLKNDVRWDMIRSSKGGLLTVTAGKVLKTALTEEKGLTLADMEGMFLLLGIGFVVAGGALVSEWVGGCTNKCIRIVRVKKEQKKKEDHRVEEETRIEDERREADFLAKSGFNSTSPSPGSTEEIVNEKKLHIQTDSPSRSSQSSSLSVHELSPSMLTDMYHGPKNKFTNIVMIDGKMMNELEAKQYANDCKVDLTKIDENFDFLKMEEEFSSTDDGESHIDAEKPDTAPFQHTRKPSFSVESKRSNSFDGGKPQNQRRNVLKLTTNHDTSKVSAKNKHVTQVEINFEASTPTDIEEFFGEKIDETTVKRRIKKYEEK